MASSARKITRLLLMLLVFAGVVPFFYPFGNPMLSWDQLQVPELPELPEIDASLPDVLNGSEEKKAEITPATGKAPGAGSSAQESETMVTIYRWRGSDGGWHFGGTPPQGTEYEVMQLNPETNIIQSEGPDEVVENVEQPAAEKDMGEMLDGFNYSPEEISRILELTEQAKNTMEERYKQQGEAMK